MEERITLRVTSQELAQWRAYAKTDGRTLSQFIRWAMQFAGASVEASKKPMLGKPIVVSNKDSKRGEKSHVRKKKK